MNQRNDLTKVEICSKFRDIGFDRMEPRISGETKRRCPRCSDSRKKSNERCVSVNVEKGTWNCHHCGFSGSVLSMEDDEQASSNSGNLSKSKNGQSVASSSSSGPSGDGKSLKRFSGKPSSDLESISEGKLQEDLSDDTAEAIEEKRNLSPETLREFGIREGKMSVGRNGSADEIQCLQFPYRQNGELINIKTRGQGKKFRMVKDADKTLWNIDAVEEGKPVIITEGEFDVLACYEADLGIPAVSVPSGANKHTCNLDWLENCWEQLDEASEFILALDNDEAGKNLEDQLSRRLDRGKCTVVEYPEECNDPNEVLEEHGPEKLNEIIDNSSPFPIDGLLYFDEMSDKIWDLYEDGFDPGKCTGWDNVDEIYRVRSGLLSIVTGIPSNGKSTFVDNLIVNMSKKHDWKIAICSPEHWPPHQHGARMMAKWAQKPFHDTYDNRLTEPEINRLVRKMNEHLYYIASDTPSDISPDGIIDTAKQAVLQFGINGLVVDPWNGLTHTTGADSEMSTSYISNKLEAFRQFAKINDVHVWMVAHPKKMDEDSVPTMYDVSGSATWYDKADCGISIEKVEDGEMRVHVKKMKFSEVGEEGTAKLNFVPGSEHLVSP